MTNAIQILVDAISLGGLYSLYALGIGLIFGIMRLINFAHASLMLGAGYTMVLTTGSHLSFRIVLALGVTIVLALLIDSAAFRPLRGHAPETLLVTSFAVFVLMASLSEALFGALPRSTYVSTSLQGTLTLGSVGFQRLNLIVLLTSAILLGLLALLLGRTRLGIQMRAVAEDLDTARLMGIGVEKVVRSAFVVSGVLAAAAGILLIAQIGTITPTFGLNPLLIGLVAAVLGGLSNLKGAALGGFVLGAFSHLVQVSLPLEIRVYRNSIVFLAVFVILVIKPAGLFAKEEVRV